MRRRLFAVVLVSSSLLACGGESSSGSAPLIPEATSASVNAPATRPVPATRSLESKTIGGEPYSPTAPNATNARPSGAAPAAQPNGAWAPTPINGEMNPSPPSGTPVYGNMNPSPPGR